MHLVLELPPGVCGPAAAAARSAGVAVATLDRYYAGLPDREGLVLGYGQATAGQIEQACGILLELLRGLLPG
jgi:DNA-binding transcriptional MocR family regulator